MTKLAGKRILVVEDEAILAMSIEDRLLDLGCIVVGPAMSLEHAERLAANEPLDAAVLDINVDNSPSFTVAVILSQRSVPFCFATGYGRDGVPPEFHQSPVLAKPFSEAALDTALATLLP